MRNEELKDDYEIRAYFVKFSCWIFVVNHVFTSHNTTVYLEDPFRFSSSLSSILGLIGKKKNENLTERRATSICTELFPPKLYVSRVDKNQIRSAFSLLLLLSYKTKLEPHLLY